MKPTEIAISVRMAYINTYMPYIPHHVWWPVLWNFHKAMEGRRLKVWGTKAQVKKGEATHVDDKYNVVHTNQNEVK